MRLRLSKFGAALIAYNAWGFFMLVMYQRYTQWFFSWSNFALEAETAGNATLSHVSDADLDLPIDNSAANATADLHESITIDYSRFVTLIFHAPLAEELVFRAGMFYVALARFVVVGAVSLPVTASLTKVVVTTLLSLYSSKDLLWCAGLSSFFFAAVHLLNALSHTFDDSYVGLQAVAAFFVGMCYCMRLAVTGSLSEVCLLHIVNNVFASPVAVDGTVSFSDWSKLLPRKLYTCVGVGMQAYCLLLSTQCCTRSSCI